MGKIRWSSFGRQAVRILPVPAAVLLSGLFVMGSSTAAFTGESSSGGSNWKAAQIRINDSASDSIGGQVLFDGEPISPGYVQERCITVLSQSNVSARVKMYGVGVTDNALTRNLRMEVDEGDSTEDSKDYSCHNFSPHDPIFVGNVSEFGREVSDYRSGVSEGKDGTRLNAGGRITYRIKLNLPPDVPNEVQGKSGEAIFKWEAQG